MRPDRRPSNGGLRGKARGADAREGRPRLAALLRAAGFLLFAASLYCILIAGQPPLGVRLGEPSPREFKARAPFKRLDLERTRAARLAAGRAEPLVFRLVPEQWDDGVESLLEGIRSGETASAWQGFPEGFDRATFARLARRLEQKQDALRAALDRMAARYWVSPTDLNHDLVKEKTATEAVLRDAAGEERRIAVSELHRLDGGSQALRQDLAPALDGFSATEASIVCGGVALVLQPNVELDLERTTSNAEKMAASQPEVTEDVAAGRIILAEGSEVTRQHIEDLTRERRRYWDSHAGRVVLVQRLAGVAIMLLILLEAAVLYARRYAIRLLAGGTQLAALVVLTLGLVELARLCVVWGSSPLWMPVPLMVMVMCLVYDQRFGLGAGVFYSVLVRLACPGANAEFLVLLLGGVMTALFAGEVRTRSTLIKAGLLAGLVQFGAVWGLGLMAVLDGPLVPLRFWESPLLANSLKALANGVACGFLVGGLLPVIERVFGITTDIRLLEWSDPSQPLLQRLLLDAPGSYHHSMVVGSLAAEAAEAIGANPLLARVSAYFHDVGKLKKPEYYAENMPEGGRNPHDELSPTMSSLIITAHPKDGAEMAQQYGVPSVVRDVILQSHGSGLLKFFWQKAQKGNGEMDEMEEGHFRYRLPKPASREAAVVMLCDAAESAARSLDAPSVGQLQNLVHNMIMDRLHDGQLDESGLTVTDLKRLEDCLVRGLTAVFHSRVTYPGQEQQTGRAGAEDKAPSAQKAPAGERNGNGD